MLNFKSQIVIAAIAAIALTLASCENNPSQSPSYVRGVVFEVTNDSDSTVVFSLHRRSTALDWLEFDIAPHSSATYDWERVAEEKGIPSKQDLLIRVFVLNSSRERKTLFEEAIDLVSFHRYLFTVYWDAARCDYSYFSNP